VAPAGDTLRAAVAQRAARFRQNHFVDASGDVISEPRHFPPALLSAAPLPARAACD
jgi:hypothetical protein